MPAVNLRRAVLVAMKCPTCGKQVEWKENQHRPFCSERCQLVDLGRWVQGEYRVPGDPVPGEQTEPADDESENW